MYGSGYFADTDKKDYKIRTKQPHTMDSIIILKNITEVFSNILAQINEPSDTLFAGRETFRG